jgi:4-hydroxyacetophenone monooxygenase
MTAQTTRITESDEFIEDAVAYADPMVLRGVLHQLTGDEALVHLDMTSRALAATSIQDVESVDDVTLLRAKAVEFLKARRDAGTTSADVGPPERLLRSLNLTAGYDIPDAERDIWAEQAALDPFARGVRWSTPRPAKPPAGFLVAVVGTGLSGLNAAVHLKRAGIAFVVIEKNPDVGGSWFENKYPGARVDTASRGYSHQFAAHYPFPDAYCPRDEQMAYLRWVTEEFGIREDIVFDTEVKAMTWDEAGQMWDIAAEGAAGPRRWRVNAIISCVGFLSRPSLPAIEGMETFLGLSCHSAQWPEGVSVDGKRVAVIGSGASGYQTLPVIARTAAHAYLFQRTPSWCFDDVDYLQRMTPQVLWLERSLPMYVNFARFRLSALRNPDSTRIGARIDPNYVDEHARSAANKYVRDGRIAYIKERLAEKPELIDKMIPLAPPLSSRPIRVDPVDNVYGALVRDNVTLVSDPIERVTPAGILAGGREYPLDIILYATGFKANDFLWPMEVRGKGGVKIEDLWEKDGPRAYLGVMLPGFPNFFMSYGPNSNNFGGFQVIDLLELMIQFALRSIAGLIEQDKQAVEVTAQAYWRFAEELDREESLMLYKDRRASNYYQNEHGRSAVNGPIDIRRMWRWLNDPAGRSVGEPDAGLKPHFGEDLIVT